MMKRRGYSIRRLIFLFFSLLFLSTVLISVFFFSSFADIAYADGLSYFTQSAERTAADLESGIQLALRQLAWIGSGAENDSYWKSENAYERMLYTQNVNNNLRGVLRASDNIDAAMVVQRNGDVVMESHRMENAVFLQLLNTYGGRRSVVPATPALFSAEGSGIPTHIILREQIVAYDTRAEYRQTVAHAYLALRLDALLETPVGDETNFLCTLQGDRLQPCCAEGRGAEMLLDALSFSSLREDDTLLINETRYMFALRPIDYGKLYLVSVQPQKTLYQSLLPLLVRGVLLIGGVLTLSIWGILAVNRRIQKPVREMMGEMTRISGGDFDYRLTPGRAQELAQISRGVNGLLDEMEERRLITEQAQTNLYEMQLLHRESQIMALQMQINPHFLYNTLECVRSIAQSYRVKEIPRIVTAMIKIYRYSVAGSYMSTVRAELECAENYAEVIRMRFGERYCFQFRVEESGGDISMPRMVLQPLIENAVAHGLAPHRESGTVQIDGATEGDCFVLHVYDDGAGISSERLDELKKELERDAHAGIDRSSIGLFNVHQRLRRAYGPEYGLTLESEEDVFTRVTVRVPLHSPQQPDGMEENV